MEKPLDPAGISTREDREECVPVALSVTRVRKNITKLLRKRQTYARYFDAGLETVDHALRRVALNRAVRSGLQIHVQGNDDLGLVSRRLKKPCLTNQAASAVASIARESLGKAKQDLKKYTKRVLALASSGQSNRARRLISWELAMEKKEKAKRDREFSGKLADRSELYRRLGPEGFERLLRKEEADRKARRRESERPFAPFYLDGWGRKVLLASPQSVVGNPREFVARRMPHPEVGPENWRFRPG